MNLQYHYFEKKSMPNATVKSFAEKSGKSIEEVEELWDKAKSIADKLKHVDKDSEQYYVYVTGSLKRMLNIEDEG